ncbi:hypothetical protein P4O66_016639, partial [Electrophorus voltai]
EADHNRPCENMKQRSFAWMWEGFSVHQCSPKLAASANDLVGCPVKKMEFPFHMTSQEERGLMQWELKVSKKETGKPIQPPPCQTNPIPLNTGLPLDDKAVKEYEKHRKILHEKRRELLLTMQKPFGFGKRDEQCSSGRGKKGVNTTGEKELPKTIPKETPKGMVHRSWPATMQPNEVRAEEKLTFKPRINKTLPDFGKMHHILENCLKKVRQKKQPTVPQPFSFQKDNSPQCRTSEVPAQELKDRGRQNIKWDVHRPMARSQSLTKSALLRAATIRRAMQVRNAEYKTELCKIMERIKNRPLLLHYQQTSFLHNMAGRFSVILEQAELDEALRWRQALLEEMDHRLCSVQQT